MINYNIYVYVHAPDLQCRTHLDYDQSLATNALKHLMDQLEERILQIDFTDLSKNVLKHL